LSDKEQVIEATDITFTYPEGTQALSGVNFHAMKGEFIAMLDSNGSGKTTLIKILVGLLKPQKGIVRVAQKDINAYSQKELYQVLGMVFQNPNDQLFGATVEEDVAFGPRNLGLDENEVQRSVTEGLRLTDAEPLRHRAIHHLSFGEQKRVALAGVLAMKPSILILDEPTAGLDPAGEYLIMKMLNRLNHEHKITVILATHSVDMLPLFADRIYILNRGLVLQHGTSEEIFLNHEMVSKAGLRLPYISSLFYELKKHDGVTIDGFPLTVGEARTELLKLIPQDMIVAEGKIESWQKH